MNIIYQSVYTLKVLEKFVTFLGPTHKVRKSPLPSDAVGRIARVEQEVSDVDQTYVDNFPYRSLLGALLYLSVNSRTDIAYAVGLLLRFGSKQYVMTRVISYARNCERRTETSFTCEFADGTVSEITWTRDILCEAFYEICRTKPYLYHLTFTSEEASKLIAMRNKADITRSSQEI